MNTPPDKKRARPLAKDEQCNNSDQRAFCKIDATELHRRIANRPEEYLRELFGDKFDKAQNGTFRVGSKGSLAVSIKDGVLFWYSHEEGLGGDAVALWQRERGGTAGEALRAVAAWSGLAPTPNGSTHQNTKSGLAKLPEPNCTHAPAPTDYSKQWSACVSRVTDERLAPIAAERGISLAFLRYAAANGWVGFYGNNVAFPVVNGDGATVACHHRLPDRSWRYEPNGQGTHPLVIGDPVQAGFAWVFESQWDAFSVLDALGVHEDADSFTKYFAVIITRGAGNGALAAKAAAGCKALVVWPQNDKPNPRTGKIASEDWMMTISATAPAGMTVRRVQTPEEHEDAAAWCKASHPSRDEILAAVTAAAHIEAPAPTEDATITSSDSAPEAPAPADILAARRFNLASPPPKPRPIYTLAGSTVATQGNIQAITGQAKSGKSALLSGFMASTMTPTGDTLGVSSSNVDGAAVIHFDTEQSRYDHHHAILQALGRAGRQAPPDWLYSYSLADVTIDERLILLRHQLDAARKAHGAIHSAIIDGIGDLCYDPNDPREAFALVAELHRMAIDFDTTILCVLHENPGSETGKTRGHLGSQLERKAESNLRMTKDADGVTTVFTANSRHASISKEQGPRFAWNDEAAMHMTVEVAAAKDSARREEMRDVAVHVFRDTPSSVGLTWEQLHQRIESAEGLKRGGSRKRFTAMKKAGVIRQTGEKYLLA